MRAQRTCDDGQSPPVVAVEREHEGEHDRECYSARAHHHHQQVALVVQVHHHCE